jgi:hypothetical protein
VIVGAAVVTAAGPVSVRSGEARIRAPTRVISRSTAGEKIVRLPDRPAGQETVTVNVAGVAGEVV